MAIYQSFDALPDELKQRVLASGAQRYGRQITPEQLLANGALAQQLMTAAGIDIGRSADDVGMRDNFSYIDDAMQPAPTVDKPRSAPQSNMRSGKGDRLDARPSSESKGSSGTDRVSSNVENVLPPRRPTYIAGTAEGEVAPAAENARGNQGSSGPANNAPSETPIVDGARSVASGAWDWLNAIISGDNLQDSAMANLGKSVRAPADNAAANTSKEEAAPASTPENSQSEGSYRDIASRAFREAPSTENVRALGRRMVESDVADADAQKLQAAGIDPASLTYGQKLRMQTMGIDRWIAEQTDQKQRDQSRRAAKATDKSGR